jgi:hypothetical protein
LWVGQSTATASALSTQTATGKNAHGEGAARSIAADRPHPSRNGGDTGLLGFTAKRHYLVGKLLSAML